MNKSKICDEINQVINILNVSEGIFINGFLLPKKELMQSIGRHILAIFPEIVEMYENGVLLQEGAEIEYWCNQMERTTHALMGEDQFLLLDVLMHELRGNLLNLIQQLEISDTLI